MWFALSDPAIEEALHDMPAFREFAELDDGATPAARRDHDPEVPPLLEKHDLVADMLRVVNDILPA